MSDPGIFVVSESERIGIEMRNGRLSLTLDFKPDLPRQRAGIASFTPAFAFPLPAHQKETAKGYATGKSLPGCLFPRLEGSS